MYFKRGKIAARTGDFSDRPKPGWQQDSYDAGIESVRQAQDAAKSQKQPKSIQALSPQRVGVLLELDKDPMVRVPPPVISHLEALNHQYRLEKIQKRADRLLGSMGRVMNRWLPRL